MADTRTAMVRLSAIVGERTLFENDAYRKLWLGRLLSHTPANAVVYTMLILIVNATGRSFFSSLFVVAYIAPTALLGTFSGVVVDRVPKGVVLAGTNVVRAVLCVLLAISTGNVLLIYVIAVLFALGSQLSGPAEGSALPSIVAPEDFAAANSLSNLGSLIAQIAGLMVLPALFLKTIGAEALSLVCALMFLAAAFNFFLIEAFGGTNVSMPVSIEETRERFAEAWRDLTMDSLAYASVVMVVLASTTLLVVVTLLPRFSTHVLGVHSENMVFVVTPAAIGIWLALRFVGSVSRRRSPWWTMGGSFGVLVFAVLLLAFVRPFGQALHDINPFGMFDPGPFGGGSARIIVTAAIASVLAFAYTLLNVIGRTIINERVPREMQGRVLAGQTVLTNLASIPPILAAGLLADIIGVTPVFFLVAVLCAGLAAYFAAKNQAMPDWARR